MSELPRNITKLRTAAYFHLKSAGALIDQDTISNNDVRAARELIERANARLHEFQVRRDIHLGRTQET